MPAGSIGWAGLTPRPPTRVYPPISTTRSMEANSGERPCTSPVSTAVPPSSKLNVTIMLVKRPKTRTMPWVVEP